VLENKKSNKNAISKVRGDINGEWVN